MASSRRAFFAQLAGGLVALKSGKALAALAAPRINPAWLTATHEVRFEGSFGSHRYVISRAWKPVRTGVIPILYKRCDGLKEPQVVRDLQWYHVTDTAVS
jgi:hypothetical protein